MSDLIFDRDGVGSDGEDAPKIEFPCRYPIKVLGAACVELETLSRQVIERYAPGMKDEDIQVKQSREGRFSSITYVIEATGVDQLSAIFEDLKKIDSVKMVL